MEIPMNKISKFLVVMKRGLFNSKANFIEEQW